MDSSKTILAKNIRYYMEKNQKTRAALCEALDIKYTTLSDWVNGKTYPRIDKLERLAAYFAHYVMIAAPSGKERLPSIFQQRKVYAKMRCGR